VIQAFVAMHISKLLEQRGLAIASKMSQNATIAKTISLSFNLCLSKHYKARIEVGLMDIEVE